MSGTETDDCLCIFYSCYLKWMTGPASCQTWISHSAPLILVTQYSIRFGPWQLPNKAPKNYAGKLIMIEIDGRVGVHADKWTEQTEDQKLNTIDKFSLLKWTLAIPVYHCDISRYTRLLVSQSMTGTTSLTISSDWAWSVSWQCVHSTGELVRAMCWQANAGLTDLVFHSWQVTSLCSAQQARLYTHDQ